MAIRKTETRVPQISGFTIDDLGQNAASTANAQVKIVSYLTSPLAVNTLQNYVVLVEDATLQTNVTSFEWTFNNNGTNTVSTTPNGVASFTPTQIGPLTVTVNLKDSANTTVNTVELQQQVAARNLELEQLIDQEGTSSPTAGNPTIAREVINGLKIYADAAGDPVTENALNRLLLSLTYSNLSANNATVRNTLLENSAAAFAATPNTFFTTAQDGIGITKLRPHLAAMFIVDGGSPMIAITERPASASAAQIRTTLATIKTAFDALAESKRIDLFNLLRFPKSNLKVCKLVLDGLRTRYFSTEAFSIVLGNRTKARRLIREFEIGPYVLPASGTSDLTATSTTTFNLMLLALWRISVSASTNPAGTIDPQTRVFEFPEPIPEKTYMANTGMFPNDGPFITSGRTYHNTFNISFTTVISLQEIIDDLQTNSTVFNHMRIFTHANESTLGLSIFRNGAGFVQPEHLDGFVTSEMQGVIGILGIYFSGGYLFSTDLADGFLTFLRSQSSPALTPFNLQATTTPLSADLRELFRRYIDTWLISIPGVVQVVVGTNAPRNLTTAETNDFISFLNVIIRLVTVPIKTAIPTLTDAHFSALRTAILTLTPAQVGITSSPPATWPSFNNNPYPDNEFTDLMRDLRSTAAALTPGNTFMTKLAHVQNNRFNASSFVDIRGCRAGSQPVGTSPPPPLLVSIQRFFGRTGALPTVTAPDWFQSFLANFRNQSLIDNADIDNLFNTGFSQGGVTLSTLEISNDFDTWSRLSNLDDQFTFFTNLFSASADLVDFASLRWRTWRTTGSTSGIPPLKLHSSRADDMVQLSLGDLLNRLKENFSATGANLAAAVVTRLNALQPKIEVFKTNEDRLTAFSGADFTSFYNDLSALATQILAIPGMPAAGTPLVDATMPSPLNRAHITGYLTNIRTYLTNSLNTDIGTIFANIRTAIGAANAKRHYYFNIRLPLRVQTATATHVQYVVFYIAGAVLDAIRSYLKCQWTGTPSQIADMHAFIDLIAMNDSNAFNQLRTAILVENEHAAIPNVVAPLADYHAHIIST